MHLEAQLKRAGLCFHALLLPTNVVQRLGTHSVTTLEDAGIRLCNFVLYGTAQVCKVAGRALGLNGKCLFHFCCC